MNVRAKGRAVNSVFLVQLRKIVATDFHGLARMENLLEDRVLSRTEGLGSVCGTEVDGFPGRPGQWIVHRGCTGNAESSGRGQGSVSRGQWPALAPGCAENQVRRRRLNSCGAVLMAPQ